MGGLTSGIDTIEVITRSSVVLVVPSITMFVHDGVMTQEDPFSDIRSVAAIYDRMLRGERICRTDPGFDILLDDFHRALIYSQRMSSSTDYAEARSLISEMTGSTVDDSVTVVPPVRFDHGRFTRFGRNVFVNSGAVFLDQGGVLLGDDVMVGPNVTFVTSNHPLDPDHRSDIISERITVGRNVWIGANVTILPGVTIGDDAAVAACSVVTRDVPGGKLVMGSPARVVKDLKDSP